MTKVAALQMSSRASIDKNFETIISLLKHNQEQVHASLVVLPENALYIGPTSQDLSTIATKSDQIKNRLSDLARSYNIWLIAGTIPIKTASNRVRASCIVFDNQGKCVTTYEKIHLFDAKISTNEIYQESSYIEPGHQVITVDTPVGCIGLAVCYDLRFPELFSSLRQQGAQLFAIPSAFLAATGKMHWQPLLQARAIENVCYVIAPNQAGKHENGRDTHGHSMIIDPWGKILIEQSNNISDILAADVDLTYLAKIRQHLPCHLHHVLQKN